MTEGERLKVVVKDGEAVETTPERFPLTDLGNAERFAAQHGRDVRYVDDWKKFRVWNGSYWEKDEAAVSQRAKMTIRSIREEANGIEDHDLRQKTWNWGVASEGGGRFDALLKLAKLEQAIATTPHIFDLDPWILACRNGTVDLRTGTLRESRREDFITRCCAVPYMAHATCPVWDAALERWTGGNPVLRRFVQKAVGSSIVGRNGDEVFFFLFGPGRNGKSKFLEGIRYPLGDYALSIRPEALMVKQGDGIPNEIAQLVGARFVATTEVEEGARIAESLVKQLTGGDTMSARFMRGEYFEFQPQLTLWISGNHLPTVRGVDKAIWERILTIPFTAEIAREERDTFLLDKLKAGAAGILAWIVQGCLLWQVEGLDPPDEVRVATDDYRGEMDILGQFIRDCCEELPAAVTPSAKLFARYADWCQSNHEKQWSQQLFGRKLRERGYESDRMGQLRVWEGLDLKSDDR